MFALPPTPLRRALDALVAFATLADAEPPPHPHRRTLTSSRTAVVRRPGTPQPRGHVCRAPLPVAHRAPAHRRVVSTRDR